VEAVEDVVTPHAGLTWNALLVESEPDQRRPRSHGRCHEDGGTHELSGRYSNRAADPFRHSVHTSGRAHLRGVSAGTSERSVDAVGVCGSEWSGAADIHGKLTRAWRLPLRPSVPARSKSLEENRLQEAFGVR